MGCKRPKKWQNVRKVLFWNFLLIQTITSKTFHHWTLELLGKLHDHSSMIVLFLMSNDENCFLYYFFHILYSNLLGFGQPTSHVIYSPERKYKHPYYISTIEIGLLWAKISYLKSHTIALDFCLQTDTWWIFQMRY